MVTLTLNYGPISLTLVSLGYNTHVAAYILPSIGTIRYKNIYQ